MIPPIMPQGKPLRLGLHQRGAHKSFDQPQHSSPFHSVERVHDVIPVEHGKEAPIDRRGRSIALVRSTTPSAFAGVAQRDLRTRHLVFASHAFGMV
jgi:hypothetical protein